MKYNFGDYTVIVSRKPNTIFQVEHYIQRTYYKDSLIYKSNWHTSETSALMSAKYEIDRHKNILAWMEQNV